MPTLAPQTTFQKRVAANKMISTVQRKQLATYGEAVLEVLELGDDADTYEARHMLIDRGIIGDNDGND